MQYALLYLETAEEFGKRSDPERAPGYWAAWTDYMKAMREAGAVRAGEALMPAHTATTLRAGGDEVQDGPYADVKEQLGGFVVIEAADLDAALGWARKAPCARPGAGAVEVRPVMVMAGEG